MKLHLFHSAIVATLSIACGLTARGQAAPESVTPKASIAAEADAIAYGLPGYSAIVTVSLRNKLQFAAGTGRYDVPGFLLNGDANHNDMKWKATVTSLQLYRVGYRFKGPMKNGPVLGAIVLNQSWKLRSDARGGETRFRPLSTGITGGYYFHVGKHFYLYPTAAFTYNTVLSGQTSVQGVPYKVSKFGPAASLHVGWEWGL